MRVHQLILRESFFQVDTFCPEVYEDVLFVFIHIGLMLCNASFEYLKVSSPYVCINFERFINCGIMSWKIKFGKINYKLPDFSP